MPTSFEQWIEEWFMITNQNYWSVRWLKNQKHSNDLKLFKKTTSALLPSSISSFKNYSCSLNVQCPNFFRATFFFREKWLTLRRFGGWDNTFCEPDYYGVLLRIPRFQTSIFVHWRWTCSPDHIWDFWTKKATYRPGDGLIQVCMKKWIFLMLRRQLLRKTQFFHDFNKLFQSY